LEKIISEAEVLVLRVMLSKRSYSDLSGQERYMKLVTNGTELLNRQLAIYLTLNLKLAYSLSKVEVDVESRI